MTGLFLSVDEYIPDPEAEAVERAIKYLTIGEDYDIVPSRSNIEGWETMHEPHGADRRPRKCTPHTPQRGSNGRFISKR